MATSIDITFTHYNRPPTEHLHFRVLTRVFQVHLLWRTKECADITIFSSQLLPARISIFDQNQEAEIFKFRWRRQSEFKNQLNLTSKILARMLHIADILFFFTNFASEFKTAEPLLRGQRAGGGVESAIKNIACHSLSPSFSAMKTHKLAPSPCLSLRKSRWPKWLWFPVGPQRGGRTHQAHHRCLSGHVLGQGIGQSGHVSGHALGQVF